MCLAFGCGAIQAQDTLVVITRPAIIITDSEQSSDSEVIRRMYEQNGRHFQDPRAPRFLFVDRTGKVALGIGGYVKGTMSADKIGRASCRERV